MAWEFQLIAGPYGGLVDALVWDGQRRLLFSVLPQDALMCYTPSSGAIDLFRPYWIRIRGLAFDADGTLYGAQAGSRRIVRFNADGSASPIRARLDGQFHNCPEDLAIDRRGRIWFADPYDTVVPRGPDIRPLLDHASVLRLEHDSLNSNLNSDWRLRRLTFDTHNPRAVLLSWDERTLYVSDTDLRAYPIQEDGTLGPGRILYRCEEPGLDGLCLDRDGNILACGAAVHVVSPDGQLLESHPTPAGTPADCVFGSTDLYVSTNEGHLYRVSTTGRQG